MFVTADNRPQIWPATTTWEAQLNDLVCSSCKDAQPRFRNYLWPQVFARQGSGEAKALFSVPIETEEASWTVWATLEGLWDRLRTLSHLAILEGEELTAMREKFDKIVKTGDGNWNEKGEIEFHGRTFYAWTERL